VAAALFAAFLITFTSEGSLGLQDPVSWLVTVGALVLVYRYLRGPLALPRGAPLPLASEPLPH
jgi:hypothetical protein